MEKQIKQKEIVVKSITKKEKISKIETQDGTINISNKIVDKIQVGKKYLVDYFESEYNGHKMLWVNKVVKEVVEQQQPQQQKPTTEYWDKKDERNLRAMVLAYAKDLAVAGVITREQIFQYAEMFINYVYNYENELHIPESGDVRERDAQIKSENNIKEEPEELPEEPPF